MFTCFGLSLFLLADTSSSALENSLSAGTEIPGMQSQTGTSLLHAAADWPSGTRECHVKYRYKSILILSTDTSSSVASIRNIDISVSVSHTTTVAPRSTAVTIPVHVEKSWPNLVEAVFLVS